MTEEWRAVADWPAYSVSSLGRIRRDVLPTHGRGAHSTYAGRIIAQVLGGRRNAYRRVRLSVGNRGRSVAVSGIVSAAFLGPRPDGHLINHIDGNKNNNAASNLEYVTPQGNVDHATRTGLKAWGERHGMAKLTADTVRRLRAAITVNDRDWAEVCGVTVGAIYAARTGRTWRNLTGSAGQEADRG